MEKADVRPATTMEGPHKVDKYSEVGGPNLVEKVNLRPIVVIKVLHEVSELGSVG